MSAATQRLAEAIAELLAEAARPTMATAPVLSWRERLWTCSPDVRLGVIELAEALGRSKAFVYRLTRSRAIPHRKLDGELVFRVGDVRAWLAQHEDVVVTARLRVMKGAAA